MNHENEPENERSTGDTTARTAVPGTTLYRTSDGRTERKRLTRLALGELPSSMRGAGKTSAKLRLALEGAVIERHGEIDLVHAGLIVTACRWERHAAIASWLFRRDFASMTAGERLTYSREIARASAERDKAVAALRLTRNEQDILDALYAAPLPDTRDIGQSSASEAAPPADASNAGVGVHD